MSVQTIIHNSIPKIEVDVVKGLLKNAANLVLKDNFRVGKGYCESSHFHDSILKDILKIKNCELTNKINNIIEAEGVFDEEKKRLKMGCNEDFSKYCADPIKAPCVDYEGKLNEKSDLEGCITQHEVNEDLYTQVEELNSSVDVSELGDSCLEYETSEEGDVTLKEVIKAYEEEICTLKEKVDALVEKDYSNMNIEGLYLTFHCLSDSCGNDITTLKQLLQALINKTCNITEDE